MKSVNLIKIFLVVAFFSFLFSQSCLAQSQLYFLHQDHLSSTVMVTNKDGNVVSSQSFYPYGAAKQKHGEVNLTNKQYTSQTKDNSTGLYYYHQRYYDPAKGIFISADKANDPNNKGNRYLYVGGKPAVINDPNGEIAPLLIAGGVIAAKVGIGIFAAGIGAFVGATIYEYGILPHLDYTPEKTAKAKLAAQAFQWGGLMTANLGAATVQLGATMHQAGMLYENYQIYKNIAGKEFIGRGGYGEVWVDWREGKAVKIYNPSAFGGNYRRAQKEAAALRGFLKKYGGGLFPKYYGGSGRMVEMEAIKGVSLKEFYRSGKTPDDIPFSYRLKAVEELRRLNQQGVLHGDINLGNIIVEKGGRIRLIDPVLTESPWSEDDIGDLIWYLGLGGGYNPYSFREQTRSIP